MKCNDGFLVFLRSSSGWAQGTYRFDIDVDGVKVRCDGKLPLNRCDKEPSVRCDDDRVVVGESGCSMSPSKHGFANLTFGRVEKVSVAIRHRGRLLVTQSLQPEYESVAPNGSGCPPVCQQAGADITIR